MKGVTALILVIVLGLTLRYMGILPINNLLISHSPYQIPYSNYGTRSIDEATINKLKTQAPAITKNLITQSIGEPYFNEHFSEPRCEVLDSTDGDWFAQAYYIYKYSFGNYSNQWYVSAWFNENCEVIYTEGIPQQGNLMPFRVTKESAIAIAKYVTRFQNLPGGYTGMDASIVYIGTYALTPRIDKYEWVVQFWKITGGDISHGGMTGESTQVIIDPNSAWVYATLTSHFSVMT